MDNINATIESNNIVASIESTDINVQLEVGGAANFLQLTDTPNAYAGNSAKLVAVNVAENALEFVAAPTGAIWGAITGTLSSQTDLQAALDSKVDENAAITPATATKITYDSKGLVTSGGTLSESDIPSLSISKTTGLQSALDDKVDENIAITPATKTKITYDSKGLVTAGSDATTADIADSLDKRYVTDSQLTVLGNTSGTNTGDQDLSLYLKLDASNDPVTGTLTLQNSADTQELIIKAKSAQTANLQEWQDSSGTVLSNINSSGWLALGTTASAGSRLSFGTYFINSASPTSSEQTSHIRLYESGATLYGIGASLDALNIAANQSTGTIRLYTNDVEHFRLSSTGLVGIGTNTPASKLHVQGVADDQVLIVQGHATQTANLQEWKNSIGTTLSSVNSAGTILATSFRVGSNSSVAGQYNLQNNQGIYSRNSTNTGDVLMMRLNASNIIDFGTGFSMGNQSITGVYSISQFTSSNWSLNNTGTAWFGGNVSIGQSSVPTTERLRVVPSSAIVGITVRGDPSQTADLQQWQSSAGTVLSNVNSVGYIGIGTNAPDNWLTVKPTFTTSGSHFASRYQPTVTTDATVLYSTYNNPIFSGTGTLGSLYGFLSLVNNTSTGTITNAFGVAVGIRNTGTGAIMTNAYGLYVDGATNGGTITTLYGLYVVSQTTGATNYAIYTNTGLNRLGDRLQIVGSSNNAQLTVTGNATQSALLAVFENSAGADQITFSGTGAAVFNEVGNDADFRVEGDGTTHLIFADASVDSVGINQPAPLSRIDINGRMGLARNVYSSNTTITIAQSVVWGDATGGSITINLPAASTCTRGIYMIGKIDSSVNTVTVDASGTETINGALTFVISSQYDKIWIQSDGSNWQIII